MRRKDREVTDINEIGSILKECKVCSIAMHDGNDIYVVPLNLGYTFEDGELTLYFHSGRRGKKLEILKENSNVGFEMNCNHELVHKEEACTYTYKYASIIGKGNVEIVEDEEGILTGLNHLMANFSEKPEHQYIAKYLKAVCIIKVNVREFSCKQNK